MPSTGRKTGSVSTQPWACHHVVDHVLVFINTYRHRSSLVQLKLTSLAAFSEDEIVDARNLLVSALKEIGPIADLVNELPKRMNSSTRSAKEATFDDIMNVLSKLDTHDHDIVFLVEDISKVPPFPPETATLMSMAEEIANLRREMNEMKHSLTEVRGDVLSQSESIRHQHMEIRSIKTAPPSLVAARNDDMQHEIPQHAHARNDETELKTTSPVQKSPEDGFQTVENKKKLKRRRRNAKAGTSSDSSSDLSSGRETFTVELTNVRPTTTCDSLKKYVMSQNADVDLVNVEDSSSEGFETKRFWLKFNEKDYPVVMKADFWPPRIYFSRRRYFGRPKNNANENGGKK